MLVILTSYFFLCMFLKAKCLSISHFIFFSVYAIKNIALFHRQTNRVFLYYRVIVFLNCLTNPSLFYLASVLLDLYVLKFSLIYVLTPLPIVFLGTSGGCEWGTPALASYVVGLLSSVCSCCFWQDSSINMTEL